MTNKQQIKPVFESLQEEIKYCESMLLDPPTESCKMFYEGKLSGLNRAKSLLQSHEIEKIALYCNDNQWHCYKCDGVVYNGDINCSGCSQKLIWPSKNKDK